MEIISVLTRIYVNDLDTVLPFYERLFNEKALRINYHEVNLELAMVGGFLLLAGSDKALKPFQATIATILVDNLDDFRRALEQRGAVMLSEPKAVPTGRNMRVRHPEGSVIEYVEHSGA